MSRIVSIPFNGSLSYAGIQKHLPGDAVVKGDRIMYRNQSIKLIMNHNHIKSNKFQEAFTFKPDRNSKTIIPEGQIVIDFTKLDALINYIETHSKKAVNDGRACEFKLQLFLPYLTETLISTLPENFRSTSTVTKEPDYDGRKVYTLKTNMMNVTFTVYERITDIIEKEMDDYKIALGLAFQGSPMPVKAFLLSEWKVILPHLFEHFRACVEDLSAKAKIQSDINNDLRNTINRLKSICDNEIENAKREASLKIHQQCQTPYTKEWMISMIDNLKV
jgi:hypothetical protein